MITIKKQTNLFLIFLMWFVASAVAGIAYRGGFLWLDKFVWHSVPWEGLFGVVAYWVVMVYAFIFWVLCFMGQFCLLFAPLFGLFMTIETYKVRKKLDLEYAERYVKHYARKMGRNAYIAGNQLHFDAQERDLFLMALHNARNLASRRSLEHWATSALVTTLAMLKSKDETVPEHWDFSKFDLVAEYITEPFKKPEFVLTIKV